MDVNDLMARAMEKWRAMSEPAEDDVAPAEQSADAPVTVTDAEPSEEPDAEPVDEETIPNEPPEPESADEPDLAGEDGPSERVDEPVDMPDEPESIPDEDVGYDVAEPDTGDGPVAELEDVEFPAEPDEPWGDEDEIPQDARLAIDDAPSMQDSQLGFVATQSQTSRSMPGQQDRQDAGSMLPSGWEGDIAQTVQQRMRETQEIVTSHLDDELSRSIYQLDILGSD